jgi:hypothetical protein
MAASAAILVLTASALSACGTTGTTKTVTVTTAATPEPDAPKRITPPQEKSSKKSPRKAPAASVLRACDANIKVKSPQTTCPFAQNVFYGYWLNEEEPGVFADSPGLPAYSRAAGRTFYLDCSGASKIVCRAGDGGYVMFPMAAVLAYTLADAKKYARTHALGDVPAPRNDPGQTDPAPRQNDDGDGDCDPNYEGTCLDPNAADYDCEGGSGDGPDYAGPVTVVGDDHFGLDRDGDGSACE